MSKISGHIPQLLASAEPNDVAPFIRALSVNAQEPGSLDGVLATHLLDMKDSSSRMTDFAEAFLLTFGGRNTVEANTGIWDEVCLAACQLAVDENVSSAVNLTQQSLDDSRK